jgi:uncharacterized protein
MNRSKCLAMCLGSLMVVISGLSLLFGDDDKPARTVKVSAMSDIRVVPDEVVITLAVVTENKQLLSAKAENDEKTCKVLDLAGKYHMEKGSFQIDEMYINPRYSRRQVQQSLPFAASKASGEDEEFAGYTVKRQITVTLRDFAIMEPIISDALSVGANRMEELLFRTTKNREYQFETRKRAVEFAKEKAGHLAELNGLKLGKAINMEEDVEGSRNTIGMASVAVPFETLSLPAPRDSMVSRSRESLPQTEAGRTPDFRTGRSGNREFIQVSNTRTEDAPQSTPAKQPIAPGFITISSTVTITFELIVP